MFFLLIGCATTAISEQTERNKRDGNELLERCSLAMKMSTDASTMSWTDLAKGTYCSGYIYGITSMNRGNQQIKEYFGTNESLFCVPKEATFRQVGRVLIKYLEDHPDKLHEHDHFLALMALTEAFPCKQ
jgi:hypothetical protein